MFLSLYCSNPFPVKMGWLWPCNSERKYTSIVWRCVCLRLDGVSKRSIPHHHHRHYVSATINQNRLCPLNASPYPVHQTRTQIGSIAFCFSIFENKVHVRERTFHTNLCRSDETPIFYSDGVLIQSFWWFCTMVMSNEYTEYTQTHTHTPYTYVTYV